MKYYHYSKTYPSGQRGVYFWTNKELTGPEAKEWELVEVSDRLPYGEDLEEENPWE